MACVHFLPHGSEYVTSVMLDVTTPKKLANQVCKKIRNFKLKYVI